MTGGHNEMPDWFLIKLSLHSGRLLVGTFVALFFNLLTLLSVRNKPFSYVSEGTLRPPVTAEFMPDSRVWSGF